MFYIVQRELYKIYTKYYRLLFTPPITPAYKQYVCEQLGKRNPVYKNNELRDVLGDEYGY